MIFSNFITLVTGLLLSTLTVGLVKFFCLKNHWVAIPRKDRWHKKATALHGGVGMMAARILSLLAFTFVGHAFQTPFLFLIGSSCLMFLLGLFDDIYGVGPLHKLLWQIVVSILVISQGFSFSFFPWALPNMVLTVLWVVGITNAINLLDNMDGLSIGIVITAICSFLFFLLQLDDNTDHSLMALLLCFLGICLGFLIYNFRPASIFMGDSGSLFLGHFLAVLFIPSPLNHFWHSSQTVSGNSPTYFSLFPFIILIVPIFDTTFVTICRLLNKRKISQGGRDHLSHRIVQMGFSERNAVLILYALSIASGSVVVFGFAESSYFWATLYINLLVILVIGFYLGRMNVYQQEQQENDFSNGRLSPVNFGPEDN